MLLAGHHLLAQLPGSSQVAVKYLRSCQKFLTSRRDKELVRLKLASALQRDGDLQRAHLELVVEVRLDVQNKVRPDLCLERTASRLSGWVAQRKSRYSGTTPR